MKPSTSLTCTSKGGITNGSLAVRQRGNIGSLLAREGSAGAAYRGLSMRSRVNGVVGLEGSRQEAILLPSTTFDIFPVVFRSAHSTPDWLAQTHPDFHCRGVGSHAPHQSPIRIKAS